MKLQKQIGGRVCPCLNSNLQQGFLAVLAPLAFALANLAFALANPAFAQWGRGGSPQFKGGTVATPTTFNGGTITVTDGDDSVWVSAKDSLRMIWASVNDSMIFAVDSAGLMTLQTPVALGATAPDNRGFLITNNAPATAGATRQFSPPLLFRGSLWDNTSSRVANWRIINAPSSGPALQTELRFDSAIDGGSYSTNMKILNNGILFLTGTTTRLESSSGHLYLRPLGANTLYLNDNGSSGYSIIGGGTNAHTGTSALTQTIFRSYNGRTASAQVHFKIESNYTAGQAGGTASNTDLLIDRTEDGLGSGTQRLIQAKVGGNERFLVNNKGVMASVVQSLTLGVGATTFAVTSNTMKITGDAGGNTIATITGGESGQLLTLIFVDGLVTITDDTSELAGTVNLSAAFTSADGTVLQLVFDGTSWREVSRSVNG